MNGSQNQFYELLCDEHCSLSVPVPGNETYGTYNQAVLVIALPIFAIFGVFGNVISFAIFVQPEMLASINCFLAGLAVSDFCIVTTAIVMFTFEATRRHSATINKIYLTTITYVFPLGTIAQTCSVYLTVCAAIDCFIYECISSKRTSFCTVRNALKMVTFIFFASVFYNIPHFFETTIVRCFDTRRNQTVQEVCATELRDSEEYYIIYYVWCYTIIMMAGPLILLTILNACIVYKVRKKSGAIARLVLMSFSSRTFSAATSDDTLALIIVVLLFIICNSLGLMINFLESYAQLGNMLTYLVDLSNVLVVVNSSVNFVIYFCFGQKFRQILIKSTCSLFKSIREQRRKVCSRFSRKKHKLLLANKHYCNYYESNSNTNGIKLTITTSGASSRTSSNSSITIYNSVVSSLSRLDTQVCNKEADFML